MLQKPALTNALCISCINIIHCSKVKTRVLCPQGANELTSTLRECGHTCPELWCKIFRTFSGRPAPPVVKEETAFANT